MAEYEGIDALMAAITDTALPEGARDDIVFMAEHRSAVADADVLREQLIIIGDALADAGGSTEPARATRKPDGSKQAKGFKRLTESGQHQRARGSRASGGGRPGGVPRKRSQRPGAFAVGTLAAAGVAALVVGMGWLVAHGGAGRTDVSGSADAKGARTGESSQSAPSRPGEGSQSAPGYIACSRLIAEGTVTEVAAVHGTTQDRITLDVYHYYKPATGAKEVSFLMDRDVEPRLSRGDEVLVGIPRHATTPDIWSTGERDIARDRSWIVKALPESRSTKCAS
ncbi:hypothetical protein [Streptomyces sp. NBC_00728]|uniref:hypothetical protein n=1 Tax=Streptomyces sp. NBC_00728 TaxID=2903676 RepID=UPI0038686E40